MLSSQIRERLYEKTLAFDLERTSRRRFYCVATATGKHTSPRTGSEDEARQFVEAGDQAPRQPEINLLNAKAYLAAADSSFVSRLWLCL